MADYTLAFTGAQIDGIIPVPPNTQVNYDQTVPTVNASVNVASVTDTSAGRFTVNFTSLYSTIEVFVQRAVGSQGTANDYTSTINSNGRTTGTLVCAAATISSTADVPTDKNSNMMQVGGPLA